MFYYINMKTNKLFGYLLMAMVYTALIAVLTFGGYKRFCVDKVSYSNYNGNWEEVEK